MQPLFTASTEVLTEKYRPRKIAEFVGLDKPRRIAAKLAANPPTTCGLLFSGEPGIGKTTLALAIAAEMPAELTRLSLSISPADSVVVKTHRQNPKPYTVVDIPTGMTYTCMSWPCNLPLCYCDAKVV